jgi:hypothetical protein
MMAFWVLRDSHCTIKRIAAKCSRQNIITILCGTNISKAKKGHNNDDDDNDIDILNEAIEAPNDINYHELWPQNPIFTIGHPSIIRILEKNNYVYN